MPYYADDLVVLHLGDCIGVMAAMPDASVDAVVTDPPYGLAELSAAVVLKAIAAWMAGDRAHVPDGRGFMGREWDKFVPPPGVWDECFRVLKPGGHLLSFAGSRTVDLMTLSIRIAGFEIRDSLQWWYGSGFPKSLDVSKAIDKAGGQSVSWFGPWLRAERERRGMTAHELCAQGGFYKNVNHGGLVVNWELGLGIPTAAQFNKVCDLLGLDYPRIEVLEREVLGTRAVHPGVAFTSDGPAELEVTAPATSEAARWSGWGTALKPAHEPIVVARKPLAGTVAGNVLEWGTGALNVDGCRVEGPAGDGHWIRNGEMGTRGIYGQGGQSGEDFGSQNPASGRWPPNILLTHSAECNGECAPACPVGELDRQSGVLHSQDPRTRAHGGAGKFANQGAGDGWRTQRGAEGWYADTGGASRFFPSLNWDAEHDAPFMYCAKAPKSERPTAEGVSAHPTVKPLAVMRWLVRLVTPPGGLVLDPFAGTGTTGQACALEGFRCVLAERDPDSAELARVRLSRPVQQQMTLDIPA